MGSIMTTVSVRVRFAPSPTGFMHLGNVRAAFFNYLFAYQQQGTFIVRIEDTDQQRLVDPGARQLLEDLSWLGFVYQEGPHVGGPYGPYFQSERNSIYREYLDVLRDKGMIYHCFCSLQELEQKRERQIALKMAPRYDRVCLRLSEKEIAEKLACDAQFIWRLKLSDGYIVIKDLARGEIQFDMSHFSDSALTRPDGTYTFIFANFVDDVAMCITHVFRGEDHLSNTATQAVLYRAFDKDLPVFWHLPIICNEHGKKLSKRDFGFSLTDLRNAGFVAEAICNYIAIAGSSFSQEIMNVQELACQLDFGVIASGGQIRYDLDKLRWINHKWIGRLSLFEVVQRCKPFLEAAYPEACELSVAQLEHLLRPVRSTLVTLQDVVSVLEFYFRRPQYDAISGEKYGIDSYTSFFSALLCNVTIETFKSEQFLQDITRLGKEHKMPLKEIFTLVRLALTGKTEGPSVKDLLDIIPQEEAFTRLQKLLTVQP
jgi:nondiscriminating glutamyl-tRNA synthetase